MATTVNYIPLKTHPLWREYQKGFTKYKQHVYRAGQDHTLSELNLEEGDTLPEDSAFEITNAQIVPDRKTGERIAVVIAQDERYV